jgi:hypothetical protein
MIVPQDIADRLRALGHVPEKYADMIRLHGTGLVRGYVERLEDADRLYREWSPRLREFAETSRVKNPCPGAGTLNERDAAKLAVFESLILKAERSPERPENEILLCTIPLVGIPVAMSLWPGADAGSVFLTPDELSQWHAIYNHPQESFWWFRYYWWHIEDPPKPDGLWTRGVELKTPEGTDPWLVVHGELLGSLAGGETAELWSWNGHEAESVRRLGCLDS